MKSGFLTSEFWAMIAIVGVAIFGGSQEQWSASITAIVAAVPAVVFIVGRIMLKLKKQ